MKSNKKAVQLSMQIVVVTLILLIVAGIVIFMFSKQSSQSGKITSETLTSLGVCLKNPEASGCDNGFPENTEPKSAEPTKVTSTSSSGDSK